MRRLLVIVLLCMILFPSFSCDNSAPKLTSYKINDNARGVIELVNNIYSTTVVSNDPNVYKAEYQAGFIQGKLQKDQIPATRDNEWDSAYLVDPSHAYPTSIPPSRNDLELAQVTLRQNWEYTMGYIFAHDGSDTGKKLRRLMYRLVGIYHGATKDSPHSLAFDDSWTPAFSDAEMTLGYETPSLTFLDLYFINTFTDIFDVLPEHPPSKQDKADRCSAFVTRLSDDDIVLAHNSWSCYLDQSQALTLWINGDYMTMNTLSPGLLGSLSDFGYTNKGIIFNETTHHATYTEPEIKSLWMVWRGTLAQQFANSIQEYFDLVSLEPSGTYMNGYMLIDAKTKEIGMVEMSYKSFIFYQPDGKGGITVKTKPEGLNTAYDEQLVGVDVLLGINYPASKQVQDDLKALDTRPARKRQFLERIGTVTDVESAKALITYTDTANPLSIFGRWDLGYGETAYPKTVPDGSIDAKVVSTSMIDYVFDLKGILDTESSVKLFWMKFGTPIVNGEPFVWSKSQWKETKLRYVPDSIDGPFTLLNGYIR